MCYSESKNVPLLACQSNPDVPVRILPEGLRVYYILLCFWFVEGVIVFFCSPLKATSLFWAVWPSSEARWLVAVGVRQCRGGPWALCVCRILVEEGQLLSAAEEGTEKLYNALDMGNGLSLNLFLIHCTSHSETNMAWDITVENKCEAVGSNS